MRLSELYKLPGLKEVFNIKGDYHTMQVVYTCQGFYFHINGDVEGPYKLLEDVIEYVSQKLVYVMDTKQIFVNSIETAVREAE